MSIRHAAIFCLAVGVTGIASAQQPNIRVQTPEAPRTNAQGANASMGDVDNAHLATCLKICNQAEIEMAKFGEEHTKNDKVKEFAEMLQKDHQAFIEKLSKFAQEGQRTTATTSTTTNAADGNDRQERREERREERQADRAANGGTAVRAEVAGVNVSTTAPNAGAANNDGHHGQHHAAIQLHREITDQCLSDGKKMLEEHKEEGKFDEAFVGMQIGAHAQMKSMLTVFEKHASGELTQVIADGRKTTEEHLKKAESLMKDLDKEADQHNNRERRQERREERKE